MHKLTIVCVKHGSLYGADYVNILVNMVYRNLPERLINKFICFTDNPEGISPEIEIRALPEGVSGWWAKLYLFSKNIFKPGERILYLDLDTVITGALDDFAEYDGILAGLNDFYTHDCFNSGVMLWDGGADLSYIWQSWLDAGKPDIVGGDQVWIERNWSQFDYIQNLFPKRVCSYKLHAQKIFPKGTSIVCFHGKPKNHDIRDGWVPHIWKIGGGSSLEMEIVGNTDELQLIANIHDCIAKDYPLLHSVDAHDKHAVIVGGGPSLKDKLQEVAFRKAQGQTVFATNNAWRLVDADYHVMLDARCENIEFVSDLPAIFASQCHPDVLAAAKNLTVYHSYAEGMDEVVKDDAREISFVGGGCSVGLKAISIAYLLGYRTFHLYGMDSSYRDDAHHAYAQPLNDKEHVISVLLNGKYYKAAAWMVKQVDEFKELAVQLIQLGCTLTVNGDGLLKDVADLMNDDSEIVDSVQIEGTWWPAYDIICRDAMFSAEDDIAKILEHCKDRRVCVQAGGNVGIWPKELAKHFETVYTFEPDHLNFECLVKNCPEHNIIKLQSALGANGGVIDLKRNSNNCGGHFVSAGGNIPIIRLDSLVLPQCDLIQLDVEGFEKAALEGAAWTIERHRPVIVIEENGCSEKYGIKSGEIGEWLKVYGYREAARIRRDIVYVTTKE